MHRLAPPSAAQGGRRLEIRCDCIQSHTFECAFTKVHVRGNANNKKLITFSYIYVTLCCGTSISNVEPNGKLINEDQNFISKIRFKYFLMLFILFLFLRERARAGGGEDTENLKRALR